MSWKKYRPDYAALYPDVKISGDVLDALKTSDYKIEYMEHDLKRERFVVDEELCAAIFLPSREDSLERLLDADMQFRDESASPEELVIETLYIQELCCELHRCLALLDSDEQALIHALFYDGLTEREYAKEIHRSKTAIHARKVNALDKLKYFLDQTGFSTGK